VSKNKFLVVHKLMASEHRLKRIWFCDSDIIFFQDPYRPMKVHLTGADAVFMKEFGGTWTGARTPMDFGKHDNRQVNTGFYVVRNIPATRAVWRDWMSADLEHMDDQTVFWMYLMDVQPNISLALFPPARFSPGRNITAALIRSNSSCSQLVVYHLNFAFSLSQKFDKMAHVTAEYRKLCGSLPQGLAWPLNVPL